MPRAIVIVILIRKVNASADVGLFFFAARVPNSNKRTTTNGLLAQSGKNKAFYVGVFSTTETTPLIR